MSENTTPVEPVATPGPRRWRPLLLGLAVALPVTAAGLFAWLEYEPQGERQLVEANYLGLDLARPDVLIESASLGRLPKDVLKVPLLRDTLTEDLVFYYENNADRLGLTGSLRRIIYEHDLQLRDNLLDELLDQPAEVALWRDAGGRLRHFVVLIQRGGLAKVLEPLAKVALDDTQLSQAGAFMVDGAAVPFYRLRYNGDRSILFASHGDQLLLMSSTDMLFGPVPQPEFDADAPVAVDENNQPIPIEPPAPGLAKVSAEAAEALLAGQHPFPERFGLGERGALQQRVTLGADFLALGYRRFQPAFAGLRFELNDQGWGSFLALDEVEGQGAFDFAPVWRAMPMGASACVALPVAPGLPERLLTKVGAEPKAAAELAGQLSGSAGLCWYPDSRLHSPLLVGTLKDTPGAQTDAELGALFDRLIGAWEPYAEGGSFPVEETAQGELHKWQRQVGSNFGQYPADLAEQPDALASRGFFRVGLARHGSTLLFSLDDRLLDTAAQTLDKRFPPLAEVLPGNALVPAYLAPDSLAALLERETLDSLPADAAADEAWQWLPLQWRAL